MNHPHPDSPAIPGQMDVWECIEEARRQQKRPLTAAEVVALQLKEQARGGSEQ